MINDRFKTYFHETFFAGKDGEFSEFLTAIEKPIPRTIRIKSNKISTVNAHLEKDGWIL